MSSRSQSPDAYTMATLESPSVAFDDPVPSDSGVFRDVASLGIRSHSVERQVQRKLLAQPNLQFSSLVVRRLPNGVCLEGVLEATDGTDICSLAQQVEGVQQVLNRLVVRGSELRAGSRNKLTSRPH